MSHQTQRVAGVRKFKSNLPLRVIHGSVVTDCWCLQEWERGLRCGVVLARIFG